MRFLSLGSSEATYALKINGDNSRMGSKMAHGAWVLEFVARMRLLIKELGKSGEMREANIWLKSSEHSVKRYSNQRTPVRLGDENTF